MRARHPLLAVAVLAAIVVAVWWVRDAPAPSSPAGDDPAVERRAPARPRPPRRSVPEPSATAREVRQRTAMAAADALVERLAAVVPLEPDLQEALAQVLREERAAATTIMDANPPGSPERDHQLDQLRTDTHARVDALLDDAQLAAYRQLRPR